MLAPIVPKIFDFTLERIPMDLSIRDLIVSNDRPEQGLRNAALRSISAGAAPIAAFDDLLKSFEPRELSAPGPEKRPDVSHEDRSDSDVRGAAKAKPDQLTHAADQWEDLPHDADIDVDLSDEATNIRSAVSTEPAPIEAARSAKTSQNSALHAFTEQTGEAGHELAVITPVMQTDLDNAAGTTVPNIPLSTKSQAVDLSSAPMAATASETPSTTIDPAVRPARLKDFASESATPTKLVPPDDDLNSETIASLVRKASNQSSTPSSSKQSNDLDAGLPTDFDHGPTSPSTKQPNLPAISAEQDFGVEAARERPLAGHGFLAAQEIDGDSILGTNGAKPLATPSALAQPHGSNSSAFPATATIGEATSAPMSGFAGAAAAEIATPLRPVPATVNGLTTVQGAAGISGNQASANGMDGAKAAAPARPATPIPLEDVAVRIARAAAGGADHITIKLKPAALGHVDVKLELTQDGRVAAVVTADRADTLDILARDAKSLERALADAGLKTDSGSLQFNLRGDGHHAFGRDDGQSAAPRTFTQRTNSVDTTNAAVGVLAGYANGRAASGGVDIRV